MKPYPHDLIPSYEKLLFAYDLPETFSIWIECNKDGEVKVNCSCSLVHAIDKNKVSRKFDQVYSTISSTVQMNNGMFDLGLKNWWDN